MKNITNQEIVNAWQAKNETLILQANGNEDRLYSLALDCYRGIGEIYCDLRNAQGFGNNYADNYRENRTNNNLSNKRLAKCLAIAGLIENTSEAIEEEIDFLS